MVIYKFKRKRFHGELKIKLNGKRFYSTESVKYLGAKTDENLTWKHHINDFSIKLNRANTLLFKVRKFVDINILRSIYFAFFESYLNFCSLVRAQNTSSIHRLVILWKNTLRIINFQPRNSNTSPFFI